MEEIKENSVVETTAEEKGIKKIINKLFSIFKKDKKNQIVENVEVSQDDIKEKRKRKEKIDINVGSKAVLRNTKYYKKLTNRDKFETLENPKNKELSITHFVTVDELGRVSNCILDKSISEYKKENPNANIMIHVASRDKIVGWMKYDDVKEKFEIKAKNDLKKQKNGFKEQLHTNSSNLTFEERISNIKNKEKEEYNTIDER